jgi:hypothetical protein
VSHTYTLLYLDDFSPLVQYQEYQGLDWSDSRNFFVVRG